MLLIHRKRKARHTSGLSFYEEKAAINVKLLHEIGLWIASTLTAVFLGVAFVTAFGLRVRMRSAAMQPEIGRETVVMVDRLSYQISTPSQGDVIAFYPGGNREAAPLVRRVAAVPGEAVQINEGILLVNGVPLRSGMQMDPIIDPGIAADSVKLRENEYFVIGDNRNNSEDSRSAYLGPVNSSWIIGRVWIALWADGEKLHLIK